MAQRKVRATSTAGFTLVEMIVAVGLFAVVMVVCVGALLSLVSANRKAQALQSVMNNLNIALDGMARAIRMGTLYECGGTSPVGNSGSNGNDCEGGDTYMSFLPYGASADNQYAWVYAFDTVNHRILKSETGGPPYLEITASEVSIDEMLFYVVGTNRGDTIQPKVVIVVKGSAGALGSSARTTFHIQATAVQRVLDL